MSDIRVIEAWRSQIVWLRKGCEQRTFYSIAKGQVNVDITEIDVAKLRLEAGEKV